MHIFTNILHTYGTLWLIRANNIPRYQISLTLVRRQFIIIPIYLMIFLYAVKVNALSPFLYCLAKLHAFFIITFLLTSGNWKMPRWQMPPFLGRTSTGFNDREFQTAVNPPLSCFLAQDAEKLNNPNRASSAKNFRHLRILFNVWKLWEILF